MSLLIWPQLTRTVGQWYSTWKSSTKSCSYSFGQRRQYAVALIGKLPWVYRTIRRQSNSTADWTTHRGQANIKVSFGKSDKKYVDYQTRRIFTRLWLTVAYLGFRKRGGGQSPPILLFPPISSLSFPPFPPLPFPFPLFPSPRLPSCPPFPLFPLEVGPLKSS